MQNQYSSVKDDNIKLLLIYIRKIQNTTKFKILASNKTALSTKTTVSRKRLDISIRKVV